MASSPGACRRPRRAVVATRRAALTPRLKCANLVHELLPHLLGFPRPDAVDGVQLRDAGRLQARQLAQRGVVEDDVRRDAALARDAEADGAQAIEEMVADPLPGLGVAPRPFGAAALRHAPLATR